MPSYREGTHEWAVQQMEQGAREAVRLLKEHGLADLEPSTVTQERWLKEVSTDPFHYGCCMAVIGKQRGDCITCSALHAQIGQAQYEALERWDAFCIWRNQAATMAELIEEGLPNDTEPQYTRRELESQGQGALL